jgi:hypothetical protein
VGRRKCLLLPQLRKVSLKYVLLFLQSLSLSFIPLWIVFELLGMELKDLMFETKELVGYFSFLILQLVNLGRERVECVLLLNHQLRNSLELLFNLLLLSSAVGFQSWVVS